MQTDGESFSRSFLYGEAILKRISFHPSFLSPFKIFVFILVSVGYKILSAANVIGNKNDLYEVASSVETLVAVNMTAIRLGTLIARRNTFLEIINMQKHFWKVDDFKDGIRDELKNLMRLSYLACKILSYFFYSAIAAALTKGLVMHELPMRLYVPNKYGLNYYTIFVIQVVYNVYGILLIAGFDIIFIALCTDTIIQFKLIKYKLENIPFDDTRDDYDDRECRNQLVDCIKHKVFMNRFVQKLSSLYSMYNFFLFLISIFGITMHLYLILEAFPTNRSLFIQSTICAISFANEMILYCLPASEITSASQEIVNAAYNSKWYQTGKFHKHILLIQIESQSDQYLSIGGLGSISRNTLTYLFKTSYTILTMMKAINLKN